MACIPIKCKGCNEIIAFRGIVLSEEQKRIIAEGKLKNATLT